MSEKQIETAILEYLRYKGFYATKVHSGAIMKSYNNKQYKVQLAEKGTPDILACIQGYFVGIEVKKDNKTKEKFQEIENKVERGEGVPKSYLREAAQAQHFLNIRESGGLTWIVCSVDDIDYLLSSYNF